MNQKYFARRRRDKLPTALATRKGSAVQEHEINAKPVWQTPHDNEHQIHAKPVWQTPLKNMHTPRNTLAHCTLRNSRRGVWRHMTLKNMRRTWNTCAHFTLRSSRRGIGTNHDHVRMDFQCGCGWRCSPVLCTCGTFATIARGIKLGNGVRGMHKMLS